MKISKDAALQIKANETKVILSGPYANGRFGVGIQVWRGGKFIALAASINEGVYKTANQAVKAAKKLIRGVRALTVSEIVLEE